MATWLSLHLIRSNERMRDRKVNWEYWSSLANEIKPIHRKVHLFRLFIGQNEVSKQKGQKRAKKRTKTTTIWKKKSERVEIPPCECLGECSKYEKVLPSQRNTKNNCFDIVIWANKLLCKFDNVDLRKICLAQSSSDWNLEPIYKALKMCYSNGNQDAFHFGADSIPPECHPLKMIA